MGINITYKILGKIKAGNTVDVWLLGYAKKVKKIAKNCPSAAIKISDVWLLAVFKGLYDTPKQTVSICKKIFFYRDHDVWLPNEKSL